MYKNSKYTVLFPLLLAAGVVLGLLLGQYMGRNSTTSEIKGMLRQMALPTNKLTYTLSLIENQYVDSVAMDSLAEHVIPLLVKELDPHSVYIPASEMQEINEPLEGEFDGIGVVFNMATDTVIVLNVIPQGPSDKAGIKAGDRIIEINDTLVAGQKIPQRDVVKKLRGPRGTTVHLGLGRQGISDLVGVDVVRDKIPIKSVESAFCIADGIGYIKLGQFARTTFDEMQASLDTLRAQGATKLIFDLRGNSGGYLDQAIMVANEFLHKDQLIVYTEDRQHKQLREYADGTGAAQDMDVVVLIDEGSASSSEILAGALQDNDRGTIVGRRSFGKGLVQRQIPYSDGSALRLTTARYYTPSGRSIQARGIEPDFYVDDTPKGNFPTFQVREADLAHHLANQQDAKKSDKDKKAEAEALPYDDNDEAKTPDWVYLFGDDKDWQLKQAIAHLKGEKVETSRLRGQPISVAKKLRAEDAAKAKAQAEAEAKKAKENTSDNKPTETQKKSE